MSDPFNKPIPPIPEGVYELKPECFPTWEFEPVPKGFSFPMEFLKFCMDWELSLVDDIKAHTTKYGDMHMSEKQDSIAYRDEHEKMHELHESRTNVRMALDIMMKHNVGTVDLSDSQWRSYNEQVGYLFANVRKKRDALSGLLPGNVTIGGVIDLTNGEGLRAALSQFTNGDVPKQVAILMLKHLKESNPEQWSKIMQMVDDPTSDVPDTIRQGIRILRDEGSL